MGAKYCAKSGCSAKTEYTVKVPSFCSSCGQPFAAAFKTIASTAAPVVPSRSAPIASRAATTWSNRPTTGDDDVSDHYDKDEVRMMARELAASMDGIVQLIPVGNNQVSMKDMLDPTKSVTVGVRGTVQTELPPQ